MAIAIQGPRVENYQAGDIITVLDRLKLFGRAAPRMPFLGTCDKGRSRLRVTTALKGDLVQLVQRQERKVEGAQTQPASELRGDPFARQPVRALRISQRLQVRLP